MALDRINRVGPVGGSDQRPVERPAGKGRKGPDSYAAARAGLGRITAGTVAPVGVARFLPVSPTTDPRAAALLSTMRTLNPAACEAHRPKIVAAIEAIAMGDA